MSEEKLKNGKIKDNNKLNNIKNKLTSKKKKRNPKLLNNYFLLLTPN